MGRVNDERLLPVPNQGVSDNTYTEKAEVNIPFNQINVGNHFILITMFSTKINKHINWI